MTPEKVISILTTLATFYSDVMSDTSPEEVEEALNYAINSVRQENYRKIDGIDTSTIMSSVDISDIPEENKHGDCFVQALNTFMKNPRKYTLVHGVVTGQGPLEGIEYCHAWVIDGDYVIDNTLPAGYNKMPVSEYYRIGDISLTHEYNASEVLEMLDKYGTYGPWDDVFNAYP